MAVSAWLSRRTPALWLTGLILLSTGLRFLAARVTPAPSIFPDELIYFDLARSLAAAGELTVLGAPFAPWTYGVLYPLLLAPVVAIAGDAEAAYIAIKLVNCVLVSLAAVPAYLLARRFVPERRAILFSAVCLALPSLVYTTKVMTESLALPVFLLTVLGLQRAVERPTTGRQLAALALLAVAGLTRMQMVVLVPAYVGAVVASAFLAAGAAPPREALRRFWPNWCLLAVPRSRRERSRRLPGLTTSSGCTPRSSGASSGAVLRSGPSTTSLSSTLRPAYCHSPPSCFWRLQR